MGSRTSNQTSTVSIPAVRRWAHRMAWRTQCLGAEAVALALCEEGSEYVVECVEEWEGSEEWEAMDADARARAVAATLLENADAALELMWEHMWGYDKTCDPSWLED
ncbi:MAG: hypothetical protein IJ092_00705 [Atopobiaceae bacterium]|nr:hypothetical protein [Atopobiaceae bacterium]